MYTKQRISKYEDYTKQPNLFYIGLCIFGLAEPFSIFYNRRRDSFNGNFLLNHARLPPTSPITPRVHYAPNYTTTIINSYFAYITVIVINVYKTPELGSINLISVTRY